MQTEVSDFASSSQSSVLSNILVTALREKQAANAPADDFSALSDIQILDIAANAAGLYSRERSWLAVEHLCALALAQALDVAKKTADGAHAH